MRIAWIVYSCMPASVIWAAAVPAVMPWPRAELVPQIQSFDRSVTWDERSAEGRYLVTRGGACPAPDRYEEDDHQAAATHFGLLGDLNVLGLNIDAGGDDDWFAFVPADDGLVAVTIWFHQHGGDLDMQLYDAAGGFLAISNSSSDFETIEWPMTAGETYAVRVYTDTGACNGYGLVVVGPDYLPDYLEQNDTSLTATEVGAIGGFFAEGLTIHSVDDEDWFTFMPCMEGDVVVSITFFHAAGDLNMSLYDSAGSPLASSNSTTDDETIVHPLTAGNLYLLHVYGQYGNRSAYQLTLDSPDPTIDCNNNGLDDSCEVYGDLDGDGDVDLADHDLFLSVLAGPGEPASCSSLDFDADGDIDLFDWSAYQARFMPLRWRR